MPEKPSTSDLVLARIELVSSVAGAPGVTDVQIRCLLNSDCEPLTHGNSYTGRPGTWIYHDSAHVLKIRGEFSFGARDAHRWISKTVNLERHLNVHHPDKTWLLIHLDKVSLIANTTPRLRPMHKLLETCQPDQGCDHLAAILALYLRVVTSSQYKLDEGLSNFAIDPPGQLFYLDDDIYPWDEFNSLSQAFGYWLRALDWLTNLSAERLGATVKTLLQQHFNDRHTAVVVAGLVAPLHMANTRQEERKKSFLQGLNPLRKQHNAKLQSPLINQQPIALLGDIHANYPALQAVLDHMDEQGVNQGLVLGDTVGYGPHPAECIHTIRQRGFTVIKGNHDYAVAENQYRLGFSSHAQKVAEWSRERLDKSDLEWLDALPCTIQQNNWLAVHGAPIDKQYFFAYVYKMTYESNLDYLAAEGISICFHGHTHITGIYYRKKQGVDDFSNKPHQSLKNYRHSLVCPGSVGQPRDNDGTGARYAIYNPLKQEITFHRIDYDVEITVGDILTNNLPGVLADRLRKGI